MSMSRRSALATLVAVVSATACSDTPTPPRDDEPAAARFDVAQVQEVPAVTIDLPPEPRAWDTSAVALEEAIAAEDGHAVIAFKAAESARALETGRREAVPTSAIDSALDLLADRGVTVIRYWRFMGAAHARFPAGTAAVLRDHDLVDYIEPRQWWAVQGVAAPLAAFGPASMAQTTPWGIDLVRAPEAWSVATGSGASIEIIDTGHDRGHEDLPLVPLGNCAGLYDGCSDGSIPHGTHVMGTFTARDNTLGVVGVSPGVAPEDVHLYAACDPDDPRGSCSTDEVINGIEASIWFDVLSMSLGDEFDFGASNAVAQAWNEGVVLVAAAGNRWDDESPPPDFYPAEYTNVIGVSGVRPDMTFAHSSPCVDPFDPSRSRASHYGDYVDLAAPFWALSTVSNNGYEDENDGWCGTSMATPHVSGTAALLREQNPGWTNQQIVDQLLATAFHPDDGPRDDFFGHGITDAACAVGLECQQPPEELDVTIKGPRTVPPDQSCFYSSTVSGGTGNYSYQWYQNGSPVSTSSTAEVWTGGYTHFGLLLEVGDGAGTTGSREILVTVDDGAQPCLN